MPTLTIEQQLRLSIVAVNMRTIKAKLRELAESSDSSDRAKYRNAVIKLEAIQDELGLPK